MCGLLYRELFVGKKSYLGGVIGQLAVTAMALLVRLSLRCGNLAHIQDVEDVNEVTFILFSYLLPFVYFYPMMDMSVHVSDLRSRYQLFHYTLPVTAVQRAAAKYIVKTVLFLYALGLSLLNVFLFDYIAPITEGTMENIGQLSDGTVLNMYVPILLIAVGVLAVDLYMTPLLLSCRKEQQVKMADMLRSLPVVLLVMIAVKVVSDASQSEEAMESLFAMIDRCMLMINNMLPSAAPLIFAVLLAAGFGLSTLAVKRREK